MQIAGLCFSIVGAHKVKPTPLLLLSGSISKRLPGQLISHCIEKKKNASLVSNVFEFSLKLSTFEKCTKSLSVSNV